MLHKCLARMTILMMAIALAFSACAVYGKHAAPPRKQWTAVEVLSTARINGVQETAVRYGTSVRGRPLIAYVLGDGANVTLITGGIHGNELSSPGVVESLRRYLLGHPAEWAGCRVVIAPHVNPDGDAAHTRANAAGVDVNRNFPDHWAPKRPGVKLSTGSAALSEPEARGLVLLLDTYHPSKALSVHQPLDELIGVGPGGMAMVNVMRPSNGYHVTGDVGYPTPGSFGNYLWNRRHIACATLEMPRVSVAKGWETNRGAMMNAIRFVYTAPSVK